MKKYNHYLIKLPFFISAICLLIYIIYTIYIKLNSSIIVTDSMILTLRILLIIALISLFIGLFIIFFRKIKSLNTNEEVIIKKEVKTESKVLKNDDIKVISTNENIIIDEEDNNLMNTNENVIVKEDKKVINTKENVVISEEVKKEKIIIKNESENKALFTRCPECNELISENAAICPHCGILFDKEVIRVLKKYDNKKEEKSYDIISILINIIITIIFVLLIILTANALIDKYNKNYNNINIEEKQK